MESLLRPRAGTAAPDCGDPEASRRVIRDSLAAVRAHLGMEVGFVSRFGRGRRWFEYVDADPLFCPVEVGSSDLLEETFCARVADGTAPA